MSTKDSVGFSQRVQLEWLDYTARRVIDGAGLQEIQSELHELLRDRLSAGSNAPDGNRRKAVSIISKIWVRPPPHLSGLHAQAISLFQKQHTRQDQLPLHWGMTAAAYPFFTAVAEVVGRLLRLQDHFTIAQAQRRIREQFGERETVIRASRRILRMFVDWGVLADTSRNGTYQSAATFEIEDRVVAAWLAEAILASTGSSSAMISALTGHPSLFPFALPTLTGFDVERSGRVEVYRQATGDDIIVERHVNLLRKGI